MKLRRTRLLLPALLLAAPASAHPGVISPAAESASLASHATTDAGEHALASSDPQDSPIDPACIAEQLELARGASAEAGSVLCTILGVGRDMARAQAGKIPHVGGLGQGIVSYVFQKFFPGCATGGPPSYFAEIYDVIRSIVRSELDQDSKQAIDAAAKNVMNALDHEYYPRKKCADLTNAFHRKDLSELLHKYDQTFLSGPSGMLSKLEANPQLGLDAYVIGAGIRLTIYQEMALVDPFLGAPGQWCKSSYGLPRNGTVAKFSDHASKFAVEAYRQIEASRRRAIGTRAGQLINQPRLADPLAPSRNDSVCDFIEPKFLNATYMCCLDWANWRGNLNARPRCSPNERAWIEQGVKGYFERVVVGELRQQLNDPTGTAGIWRELIEKPVPLECTSP